VTCGSYDDVLKSLILAEPIDISAELLAATDEELLLFLPLLTAAANAEYWQAVNEARSDGRDDCQ
jgi:hypothetical protein